MSILKSDFIGITGLMLLLAASCAPAVIADQGNAEAQAVRKNAWNTAVSRAATPEDKQLTMFVRSEVEGCRSWTNVDQEYQSGTIYSINKTEVKNLEIKRLIVHEQACLDTLRGKVLAGMPSGQARILEATIPQ